MKQFLILKKALMSKLKSDIRRNKDHLATNERLKELLTTNPKAPVRFKFYLTMPHLQLLKLISVGTGDQSASCLMKLGSF